MKRLTREEYYNPLSFIHLLIDHNYVIVIRHDHAEFVREYFTRKFAIPFHVSEEITDFRLIGFPMSKHLDGKTKDKITEL